MLTKHAKLLLTTGLALSLGSLTGCESERLAKLQDQNESLRDENDSLRRSKNELSVQTSRAQAELSDSNRQLGILDERYKQLQRAASDARAEASRLRMEQREADRKSREAERELQEAQRMTEAANNFREKEDEIKDEIAALKGRIRDLEQQEGEWERLEAEYDRLNTGNAKQIQRPQGTVSELQSEIESQRLLVEEGEQVLAKLRETESLVAEISGSHPEYFLSYLERHAALSHDDFLVWNEVSLSYTGGIRSLGAELSLILPLPVLDHRGPIRLTYGSLEVTAISMSIDLDSGMVKIGFPEDRKLRDSMSLNSSTELVVSFGPADNRSELEFSIGEEEEKLGMTTVPFLLQAIRLGDLPIARRDDMNMWSRVD